MKLNLVGVDLSKSVFQLSIANNNNRIVSRKRLSRTQFRRWLSTSEASHLVMEACGTSHYWARVASDFGHQVSLLHPKYVKPYVRRNKTDAADADALVRAGQDTDLIPVPIKTEDHQALQSVLTSLTVGEIRKSGYKSIDWRQFTRSQLERRHKSPLSC